MNTKLFPYQEEGVAKIKQFGGRVLLADEQGTGKSIQSIKYIVDTNAYPAVIVCPATLKLNWQREFWIHFGKRTEVLSGGKAEALRSTGSPVYIINYDILAKWENELTALKPKVIVLDEVQSCKTITTQRTKAALRLSKNIPHVLALSGTPMMNHPTELYPILRMVLGERNIESRREFCDRYSKLVLTRWGFKYQGSRRLPELHQRLKKTCMIRRLLKEVLKDLPEKTRQTLPVALPRAAMSEYVQMSTAFDEWMQENHPEKDISVSANVLAKLGYMKRKVAEWKLPFIFDWIDRFLEESDSKLLVFGLHHSILRAIMERYQKCSGRYPFAVKIDGTVSMHDRQRAVDLFQTKPQVRLFIGQMRAAGVGLTLTAAHNVLFAECDFVPAVHSQVENRSLRVGQKNHVLCTYIVASQTIEEHVAEILYRKQQEFDAVVDGGRNVDSFNIVKELLKRLRSQFV